LQASNPPQPAPAQAAQPAPPPASATPAAASPSAAPEERLEPALRKLLATKELPYATLRKALLDGAWLPLRDPMCWDNIGGQAEVCYTLPEVHSCSGDGYCVMHFAERERGLNIRVKTYGDYRRWGRAGEESALLIDSASVSAVPAPAADKAPACPARDFDAFLKAFASDAAVKARYTAPLVRVAEIGGGEDGDDTVPVLVAGESYKDFNVEYAGNAFHYVDAEGKRDGSALEMKIEEVAKGVRDVSYQYGMSEGNSYRFEDAGDCWYLKEDPQPPSP
jgi:hypothetical protein